MTENAASVTLANSEVTLVFEKKGGKLTSLVCRGKDCCPWRGLYPGCLGKQQRQAADPVGVSRLPPRARSGGDQLREHRSALPVCFGAHYILRADEPGFHNYLTWGHDAVRNPGVHELAQFNFCLRADPRLFTTAAVDDERIRPFPRPETLRREQMVMDATYRLPDGTFYSKYFFSAAMDERHVVHGMMGEGIGLWIVMPNHEHLNGGPEHQELTVHQTGSSPVVLYHATAAHYGRRRDHSRFPQRLVVEGLGSLLCLHQPRGQPSRTLAGRQTPRCRGSRGVALSLAGGREIPTRPWPGDRPVAVR